MINYSRCKHFYFRDIVGLDRYCCLFRSNFKKKDTNSLLPKMDAIVSNHQFLQNPLVF